MDVEKETVFLLEQASALLRLIDNAMSGAPEPDVKSVKEARRVIALYVERLTVAIESGDPEQLLRACNALTSTNKGLSDTIWVEGIPEISAQAMKVSHHAWTAGDQVRRRVGHL